MQKDANLKTNSYKYVTKYTLADVCMYNASETNRNGLKYLHRHVKSSHLKNMAQGH